MSKDNDKPDDFLIELVDIGLELATTVGPMAAIGKVADFIDQKKRKRTIDNLVSFFREAGWNEEKRKKFQKELGSDYEQFMEDLLLAVERMDKEDKAGILGKLMDALFNKKLQRNEFMKLAKMLDAIHISTLDFFLQNPPRIMPVKTIRSEETQLYQELMGQGLMSPVFELEEDRQRKLAMGTSRTIVVQMYKTTLLGDLLLKLVTTE